MSNAMEPSPELVEGIVKKLKTNGMFDQMRRDCLADIDTKPAFQNLKQRVENFVNALLSSEVWTPSLNKNQLRGKVRTSVMQSGMLNTGIEHILHQVVDAKMYTQFLPKITEFVDENDEALRKEFVVPEEPEQIEEPEEEECPPIPSDTPPPLPLVQQDEIENDKSNEIEKEEVLPDAISEKEDNSKPVLENETETTEEVEGQPSVIPEGTANTLRNLLQSLVGSNMHLLTQENNENADKEGEDVGEAKKETNQTGNSPSIDPSHIEAFTDNSDESEASDADPVGPKTPEELDMEVTEENDDNVCEVMSEASSEGISEDDQSSKEISENESDPENVNKHSENDASDSEPEYTLNKQTSDVDSLKDEGNIEYHESSGVERYVEEHDHNETVVSITEELHETVEEVTVVENVYEEELVFEEGENEEYEQVVVTEDVTEEPEKDPEPVIVPEQPVERKRRHKRHHKRRQRSSSEDSSDDSGQVESSPDSDRELESGEELSHRSRARKKRRKKRSKKHKRQKSKTHEHSPPPIEHVTERRRNSSSEYLRSSMSPTQSAIPRRFMTSPGDRPIRFEDDGRSVKVEPVFMPQMPPRYRDPYAIGHRDMDIPRHDIDRPYAPPPHGDPGFRPRYSPPHGFVPPPFGPHARFSPPYGRGYHPRSGSPPPRRYSPTFDYYRRYSPPRRFPGPPPHPFGPHDDRPPMHGPPHLPPPPGSMIRHESLDIRHPPR